MTLALVFMFTSLVGTGLVAVFERRPRPMVPVPVLTTRTRRPRR